MSLLRFLAFSSVWILVLAATEYHPFLELDNPIHLRRGNDGRSAQITIPSGLQFGTITQYKVYVSINGYFTFESQSTACCPRFFNSRNHIVAPFWADADTRIAGNVSYQVFNTSIGPDLLEEVSTFIATKQGVTFAGQWMLVADWKGISSFRGSPAITNSFQGLVITNGSTSYAIFTYKCGLLEWSGDAVIGFRSERDHFTIHPLSGSSAQLVACQNISASNWTNIIYQLNEEREDVEECKDVAGTVTREETENYGRCVPYVKSPRGSPCDPLFREGLDHVFVPSRRTSGDITQLNSFVADAGLVVNLISEACREPARQLLCYFYYPPCGNSTVFEPPKAVCSETCIHLRDDRCATEWASAIQYFNGIADSVTRNGLNFIDCNNPGAFIYPLPHCCFDAGIMTTSVTDQPSNSIMITVQPTRDPPTTMITVPPTTVTTVAASNSSISANQSKGIVTGVALGAVGFIVILTIVASVLAFVAVKHRRSQSHEMKSVAPFLVPDIRGPGSPLSPNSTNARYFSGFNLPPPPLPPLRRSRAAKVTSGYLRQMTEAKLLISGRQIHLQDCIGKGEFGVVYRAHLIGWGDSTTPELVAVKTPKAAFSRKDINELMEESLKMKALSHPNVLNLIGVSIDAGESPYIIMPYMANGNLLSYLKKERPNLTIAEGASADLIIPARKKLLSICLQIAKGMEYLAGKKFVHRDLAARNCMIDADFVIKVADFGLCEDIYARNYFRQMKRESDVKLPIRWMALESLQDGMFTESTDVWSFGVTCWEVFSLGKSPYPGVDPFAIVKFLESGQRLEKPSNAACSEEMYTMIFQCWNEQADKRPSFSDLVLQVSKLLEVIAEYIPIFSSMPTKQSDSPNDKDDCFEKDSCGDECLADIPTDIDTCTDCSTNDSADSN